MLTRMVGVVGVSVALTAAAGCVEPLALDGRPCPCSGPGYACCTATGICLPTVLASQKSCALDDPEDAAAPVSPPLDPPPLDPPPADPPEDPPLDPPTADPADAAPDPPDAATPAPVATPLDAAPLDPPDAPIVAADAVADTGGHETSLRLTIEGVQDGGEARGIVRLAAVVEGDFVPARVDLVIDGTTRRSFTARPFIFDWYSHHEVMGRYPAAAHRIKVTAVDAQERRLEREVTVFAVPLLPGDCDQNGRVDQDDVIAVGAEVADNFGEDPESAGGGGYPGGPACDANEDNIIDRDDETCVARLAQGSPRCWDVTEPALLPVLFAPSDYHSAVADGSLASFFGDKVEETRRFFARNNAGKTFRTLPVQLVMGGHDSAFYWGTDRYVEDTTGEVRRAYERRLAEELRAQGVPTHPDWARGPWNRVVWVLAMGAGPTVSFGRHFATGHGFAVWSDTQALAAMDLGCGRVRPVLAVDTAVQECETWRSSGQIYGYALGRAMEVLGNALMLNPHTWGTDEWRVSLMGQYWLYPAVTLVDRDRRPLAVSHFIPRFVDTMGPSFSFRTPAHDAQVSGVVDIFAEATDNYGIRRFELSIDGSPVDVQPQQLYAGNSIEGLRLQYAWNTADVPAGPHKLRVTVQDTSGQPAGSLEMTVRRR